MSAQISIRHMAASKLIRKMIQDLCSEVKNKYAYIQDIDVKIDDINGPYKSGVDKHCHLKVRGHNHLAIDVDEDVTHAIDRAFRHLKKTLKIYSLNKHKRLSKHDNYNNYLSGVCGECYE